MEHKIIISIQPFDMFQNINVIDDNGAIIHSTTSSIQTLSKTIKNLSTNFNANEVILQGNQSYLEKFKTDMITEFSNNPIKVTII